MTFIPGSAKDDLALFSSSKFIGSYQLQLEAEKEMGDYVMRTLKVGNILNISRTNKLAPLKFRLSLYYYNSNSNLRPKDSTI